MRKKLRKIWRILTGRDVLGIDEAGKIYDATEGRADVDTIRLGISLTADVLGSEVSVIPEGKEKIQGLNARIKTALEKGNSIKVREREIIESLMKKVREHEISVNDAMITMGAEVSRLQTQADTTKKVMDWWKG